MKVFVSGGQFFIDGFAVRRAFSLDEGERRLLCFVSEGGCGCCFAMAQGGKLLLTGDGVDLIRWREGLELCPAPRLLSCLLRKASLDLHVGETDLCAMYLPPNRLSVSGAVNEVWETSAPLFAPRFERIDGQKDAIVKLSASCPEGEYLAMISLSKGSARLLLETCGESILCRGNEVTVKRSYDDLLKRTVTTTYLWQGDGFNCSKMIKCANDHTFKQEEIGRMLLESVVIGDENVIKDLLSPEIADASAVTDYFGKILSVRKPLFAKSPTAIAALTRRGKELVAVTYDFEFDGAGRIQNIRSDEE